MLIHSMDASLLQLQSCVEIAWPAKSKNNLFSGGNFELAESTP